MNGMTTLTSALLDLLHELEGTDIKLIVGGGFGIYLKHLELLKTNPRTLLRHWPEPRSTNDLDLFLRTELLTDASKLVPLLKALGKLGYRPVETARYYQFFKPGPLGGETGSLKVDILTGPEQALRSAGVIARNRRAYPKPKIALHAHTMDEALTLEEHLQDVSLAGRQDTGEAVTPTVFLPHPFTFILMKLFALRDRINDPEKDYGRHHALDLYSIVAMMTEEEWRVALDLHKRYRADAKIAEAGQLVSELFANSFSLGVLRLKESPYYRNKFQTSEFLAVIGDLFAGSFD